MICRDLSFSTPGENLLFDDFLLARAEAGAIGETLRFWQSTVYFVVLGRLGDVRRECHLDRLLSDGVGVFRRSSGGGTVVQGPGCLNYALILDKNTHPSLAGIRGSYELILGKVIDVLVGVGIQAMSFPISDLALEENRMKISGNAQKRGKQFILHHGTLLCGFNLNLIGRYLRHPPEKPAWREDRPHEQFVTNLPTVNQDALKDSFRRQFSCTREEAVFDLDEREAFREFQINRSVGVDIA
jgi:lipoate---protein ligase